MIIAWIYEVPWSISVPMGEWEGSKMATDALSNTRIRFRNTADYKCEYVMGDVLVQYMSVRRICRITALYRAHFTLRQDII